MAYIRTAHSTSKRTVNYRFTVDSEVDMDLRKLRASIAEQNRGSDIKQVVRVRPRGPRCGNRYDTPFIAAQRFDVYVYTR